MLSKGQAHNLGNIIATILVAAVIATVLLGPLYAKIAEGFGEAQKFTNVAGEIKIDNPEEMAAAMRYVWDRSLSCDKVDGKAYPSLAATSLGSNPPCAGTTGTLAAGLENLIGNTGGDMEGEFGMIKFKINDSFTMNTGMYYGQGGGSHNPGGGDWDDSEKSAILTAGAGNPFSEYIAGGCWGYFSEAQAHSDAHSVFSLHFLETGASSRITSQGAGWTIDNAIGPASYDKSFCSSLDPGDALLQVKNKMGAATNLFDHYGAPHDCPGGVGCASGHLDIQFCEGDEGVMQSNKGNPTNSGEHTGALGGGEVFPFIEIEETGPSC